MPFYKPSKDPESYYPNKMNVVPVIASFDTSGNIKPLYVRIQEKSLKIYSCWWQKESLLIKYHCIIEQDGYEQNIILLYHPAHSFWTIPVDRTADKK